MQLPGVKLPLSLVCVTEGTGDDDDQPIRLHEVDERTCD